MNKAKAKVNDKWNERISQAADQSISRRGGLKENFI